MHRRSKLSLGNKLTIYNMILKPSWTYGIAMKTSSAVLLVTMALVVCFCVTVEATSFDDWLRTYFDDETECIPQGEEIVRGQRLFNLRGGFKGWEMDAGALASGLGWISGLEWNDLESGLDGFVDSGNVEVVMDDLDSILFWLNPTVQYRGSK
ncbi:hypothetical protein AAG570_005934 [Ranatra chinensis]|uniref:Uncharacterized protein n=1 Tax=Ranatra chinensis TaxID=642074 RepID=A0ABD0XWJ5_9HEMI